jgi:hypothetical protein
VKQAGRLRPGVFGDRLEEKYRLRCIIPTEVTIFFGTALAFNRFVESDKSMIHMSLEETSFLLIQPAMKLGCSFSAQG